MNEELERSNWFSQEKMKNEIRKFAQDLFGLKSYTLANYISENLLAADLKWSLFCAACNSYRFDSVLKPFPPAFLQQDDVKEIERLREVIELCPSMPNVLKQLKENTLSSTLKDLLYWVLIELKDPGYKYVPKEERQEIFSQVSLTINTAMPDYVFSVIPNERQQQRFSLIAANHRTKFAFHGSRVDNFYSIINYGLQVSLNKVAAFGPGIYLSNDMSVSLSYSPRGFTWNSSHFGSHISIVAMCEIIDHPDVKSELDPHKESLFHSKNTPSTPAKYTIVGNSDLVRIQYLLLYNAEEFDSSPLLHSPTLIGWIKRHKMITFLVGYLILLLGIGSSHSSFFYKYYRRILRQFDNKDNQW